MHCGFDTVAVHAGFFYDLASSLMETWKMALLKKVGDDGVVVERERERERGNESSKRFIYQTTSIYKEKILLHCIYEMKNLSMKFSFILISLVYRT